MEPSEALTQQDIEKAIQQKLAYAFSQTQKDAMDAFLKKMLEDPSIDLDALDEFVYEKKLCSLFFSQKAYAALEHESKSKQTTKLATHVIARLKILSSFKNITITTLSEIFVFGFIALMLYCNSTNSAQFVSKITQNIPLIVCLSIVLGIFAISNLITIKDICCARHKLHILYKPGAPFYKLEKNIPKRDIDNAVKDIQSSSNQKLGSHFGFFVSIISACSSISIIASSCLLAKDYNSFDMKWLIVSIVIFVAISMIFILITMCSAFAIYSTLDEKNDIQKKLLTENDLHAGGAIYASDVDDLANKSYVDDVYVDDVKSKISLPYCTSKTLLMQK